MNKWRKVRPMSKRTLLPLLPMLAAAATLLGAEHAANAGPHDDEASPEYKWEVCARKIRGIEAETLHAIKAATDLAIYIRESAFHEIPPPLYGKVGDEKQYAEPDDMCRETKDPNNWRSIARSKTCEREQYLRSMIEGTTLQNASECRSETKDEDLGMCFNRPTFPMSRCLKVSLDGDLICDRSKTAIQVEIHRELSLMRCQRILKEAERAAENLNTMLPRFNRVAQEKHEKFKVERDKPKKTVGPSKPPPKRVKKFPQKR